MKTTCQAGVHSFILRSGLAAAAVLGLASCGGGDSPDMLGQALAEASATVDWVADDEQACVGGAIIDTVGFETLVADGVTSELLAASPDTIDRLLDEGSDELDGAVEQCIDADRLFRASLAADLDIDVAECDNDFSDAALAKANRTEVLHDGAPLVLTDTADHRDLLRPCLDEATFGAAFGLDTPIELIDAISADLPAGLREISTEPDCLADRVVSKFGVETLEGLGITAASPDLDLDAFTDEEATTITRSAIECGDATTKWRRALVNISEPLADCVVDAGGAEYTEQTVAMAFGDSGAQRAREQIEADGIETCANDRSAEAFGSLSALDRIEADFVARTWINEWERDATFDFLPAEDLFRCAMRGAYAELGKNAIDAMFIEANTLDPESIEAWEATAPLWGAIRISQRACGGDWYFISTEMHQAGTSPETLACIRERLGDDAAISDMADTLVAYSLDWSDYRWESVLFEIDANFDRCRTDAELRIYNQWHDYMLGGLDLTGVNTGVDTA
jgi:hypothetical protein